MKRNRMVRGILALLAGGMPLVTEVECDPVTGGFWVYRDDDSDYYYDDYYYEDMYYYDDCFFLECY